MRAPSFQHGMRGCATSRTALPTSQRSPTTAPVTSTPDTVRFSPKFPCSSSRPISRSHQTVSSRA